MDRRSLLKTSLGCAVGVASAGCLEAFSSDSAWRELVVDRPDGVYVPAKIDEMIAYGTTTAGPYGIAVTAKRPHSFFTVAGSETTQVSHRSDDSIHLMVSLWDRATEEFVPSSVRTTVRRDGDVVDDRQLWPMLSQRMGVHYGDNVALSSDGAYDLTIRIDPPAVRTTGAFDGRFDAPERATLSIDYAASEIDALERTLLDVDQRGGRGALELMGDGGGDGSDGGDDERGHAGDRERDGHPPATTVPAADALPGTTLGTPTVDDAVLATTVLEESPGRERERRTGDDANAYLAVSLRTPYNRCPLPMASLSLSLSPTPVRERTDAPDSELQLRETLDPGLGHHYGAHLESVGGDEDAFSFSLSVDTPPQLSRHEGNETAFLETGSVTGTMP